MLGSNQPLPLYESGTFTRKFMIPWLNFSLYNRSEVCLQTSYSDNYNSWQQTHKSGCVLLRYVHKCISIPTLYHSFSTTIDTRIKNNIAVPMPIKNPANILSLPRYVPAGPRAGFFVSFTKLI